MYWEIARPMSYNPFLAMIVGNRGGGKTYGSQKWCIQHFLRTGQRFVWVRRYKTEFEDLPEFFDKVAVEFPEHELKVRGRKLYCDGKMCGKAVQLSTSRMKKGAVYKDFDTIVFDEFLIDKSVYHYLPDEVGTFLDLVDTVFRGRDDVRCILLANTVTVANPYFLYFNIFPPEDVGIVYRDDKLVELVADPEFIEAKSKTRFGRLIEGTAYGAYNVKAEFSRDNSDFIEERTGRCQYFLTIIYRGEQVGVWCNFESGKIYISKAVDKSCPRRYVLMTEDLRPNTLLLSTVQRGYYLKILAKNFRLGNVYFEDQELKKIGFQIGELLKNA